MAATVEVYETRTVEIEDRRITTLELAPHARLDSVEQPALLLMLDGTSVLGGTQLSPGEWAIVHTPDGTAGADGCLLAVMSLAADAPAETTIGDDGPLAWYEKYEASVRALATNAERPLLAPWTGYWVAIPTGRNGTAAVHVHHELLNIAVIAGGPAAVVGYLLVDSDQGSRAWELRGGDLVTVGRGVIHNLVAVPGHAPLRFFVFNDSPSDYVASETSDYHNLRRVDVASLPVQRHPSKRAWFSARVQ